MTTHAREPRVLWHKAHLWVLDKPAGWMVHPAGRSEAPDLLAWARAQPQIPEGLAPAHRLDQETSGLVLCSPNAQVRGELGRYFTQGLVKKTYLALVYGTAPLEGLLQSPLADARRGRPLEAETRFVRLRQFRGSALLEVHPHTGRKHQIRRHLQEMGHAVVGDTRYRPERLLRLPGFPGRLWLHALSVELPDGRRFSSPLAPELQAQLDLLERLEEPGPAT